MARRWRWPRRWRRPASCGRSASSSSAVRARDAAAQARETDPWSITAMLGFALLCLLAGIFPGAVIDELAPVRSGTDRGADAGAVGRRRG